MGFCKGRQNKRKQRKGEKSKKGGAGESERAGKGERGDKIDGDRQKEEEELGLEKKYKGKMEALAFSEVD